MSKKHSETKEKAKQKGMSLIEIVISIAIIASILVLYQVALNGILLVRNAKDQDLALRIAANKLEGLRAGGYAALPASGTFSDSLLSSLPQGSGNMTMTDFNSKTKQVDIRVSWQEPGSSSAHQVTLTTLITQVGGLK